MNKEQEKNIHGFTGDIKDFIREGDFESALILIDDLKKYVVKLKGAKSYAPKYLNYDTNDIFDEYGNAV